MDVRRRKAEPIQIVFVPSCVNLVVSPVPPYKQPETQHTVLM
jgi:hypothetical protein